MAVFKDTIVALASGSVPSGIAVLRISGTQCQLILEKFVPKSAVLRHLQLRDIVDPVDQSLIDQAMVFFAKAPHSFTGEDVVEFHLHGSPAIVQKAIDSLLNIPKVRLAQPGEFTRRAFENNCLDLSKVEGLKDLLNAESESQRIQAMARYRGGLSDIVDMWRAELVEVLAIIEANLDFSDEEDVGLLDVKTIAANLQTLANGLEFKLAGFNSARMVRDGFRVGVAGLPNVGKSSIINALSKSNRAIVTSEEGTTRDIQEVRIELGGHLIILLDSAGIRKSDSIAETEGVKRSVEMIKHCDLVLWISSPDVEHSEKVHDVNIPHIHISNKSDLKFGIGAEFSICAHSGDVSRIEEVLLSFTEAASLDAGSLLVSSERDRVALVLGLRGIQATLLALKSNSGSLQLELIAEELRSSIFALERLLGKVGSEDILDKLFDGFCIGK